MGLFFFLCSILAVLMTTSLFRIHKTFLFENEFDIESLKTKRWKLAMKVTQFKCGWSVCLASGRSGVGNLIATDLTLKNRYWQFRCRTQQAWVWLVRGDDHYKRMFLSACHAKVPLNSWVWDPESLGINLVSLYCFVLRFFLMNHTKTIAKITATIQPRQMKVAIFISQHLYSGPSLVVSVLKS